MQRRVLFENNGQSRQLVRDANNQPIIEDRRFLTSSIEVRSEAGQPTKLVGYAARFMSLSEDLGGFKERILPGTFKRTLQSGFDFVSLDSHNWEKPIARYSAGTLKLYEDSHGLRFESDVPDTTVGRDLIANIDNGNIKGMSFGFNIVNSTVVEEADLIVQELRDVDLYEVSFCVYPAYSATSVSRRHIEPYLQQERTVELESDNDAEHFRRLTEVAQIQLRIIESNLAG